MKYYVNWDNGNDACGQIGPFPTPADASNCAYEVLEGWMESTMNEDTDSWNDMIDNAYVSIDEYDPNTDSMYTYWEPTDAELAVIGWIEREE